MGEKERVVRFLAICGDTSLFQKKKKKVREVGIEPSSTPSRVPYLTIDNTYQVYYIASLALTAG